MHTQLWTPLLGPPSDAAGVDVTQRSSFNRLGKEPWKVSREVEKSFIEFRKPMLPSMARLFRATSDAIGAIWYTSKTLLAH